MNLFQKIKTRFTFDSSDERQQEVQRSASWKSAGIFFLVYLAIVAIYEYKSIIMPWSTSVLFLVAIVTFFINILRHDGFTFTLPGVKEYKKTLALPTSVRAVPWVLLIEGILSSSFALLGSQGREIYNSLHLNVIVTYLIAALLICLGIAINWYIASRIRYGSKFWIGVIILGGFLTLFQLPADFSIMLHATLFRGEYIRFFYPTDGSFYSNNLSFIHDLINIWAAYILTRYYSQITSVDIVASKRIERFKKMAGWKRALWILGIYAFLATTVVIFGASGNENLGIASVVIGIMGTLSLFGILIYAIAKGFFSTAVKVAKKIERNDKKE